MSDTRWFTRLAVPSEADLDPISLRKERYSPNRLRKMSDTQWHTTLLDQDLFGDIPGVVNPNFAQARRRTMKAFSAAANVDNTFDIAVCDTTSGAFTMTLPGTPVDGDVFGFVRVAGAGTLTIGRNGNNIDGAASDATITSSWVVKFVVWSTDANSWISYP